MHMWITWLSGLWQDTVTKKSGLEYGAAWHYGYPISCLQSTTKSVCSTAMGEIFSKLSIVRRTHVTCPFGCSSLFFIPLLSSLQYRGAVRRKQWMAYNYCLGIGTAHFVCDLSLWHIILPCTRLALCPTSQFQIFWQITFNNETYFPS